MTSDANSTDEKYWSEYDGLQHAKHQLLGTYLKGWFPILCSWSSHVLYIDCHAGRGRHQTGHEGSPILALRTLREHRLCPRILGSTTMDFIFFEIDQSNYNHLCTEIQSLRWQPGNVNIHCFHTDYATELRRIIRDCEQHGQKLDPTFAFVDPYGFKLSMDLLNDLLSFPHCELLINFMYRYVDMAIHNPVQAANLDTLFGSPEWRRLVNIDDYDKRTEEIIDFFASQLNAKFVTHMYMRAQNGTLKYVLFHATNDRRGREVIKDAMWSVTPDGSFTAFEHHHPDQLVFITPKPDLNPLRDHLWNRFAGQQVYMDEIYDWLLDELYRKPHLHEILTEYRKQKIVKFNNYAGRFGFDKNPTVLFPPQRPESQLTSLLLF